MPTVFERIQKQYQLDCIQDIVMYYCGHAVIYPGRTMLEIIEETFFEKLLIEIQNAFNPEYNQLSARDAFFAYCSETRDGYLLLPAWKEGTIRLHVLHSFGAYPNEWVHLPMTGDDTVEYPTEILKCISYYTKMTVGSVVRDDGYRSIHLYTSDVCEVILSYYDGVLLNMNMPYIIV
jgi:hypothetical protein